MPDQSGMTVRDEVSPLAAKFLDRGQQRALARRPTVARIAGQFGNARLLPPSLDIGDERLKRDRLP